MKKCLSIVSLTTVLAFTAFQPVLADIQMKTDMIYNHKDSAKKCADACSLSWNGNWVTTKEGKMSICSLDNKAGHTIMSKHGGVEAGPIWSNGDAATKCNVLAAKFKPNGHWKVIEPGKMSVCGCTSGEGDGGKADTWVPNNIDSSQPSEEAKKEADLANGK